MKISLEALELLDAIDLRGSFAGAAAALHRVPSAVPHAVRRLEADLGVTLYARQGRRAVLTEAGRTLLEQGRHLLAAAGELECRVQRVATGWENELRIAVEAVVEPSRLLPLVAEFDKTNGADSGTRLRFGIEVLAGCWEAVLSGRADLAVGASGEPPPGGGWQTRPLGEMEFVFTLAPHHPLAALPEPLGAEDIARHRAVAVADSSRELMARTVGLLSGQPVLTVADASSKRAAQIAGLGIGYLPRWMAEEDVAAGRLVIRRTREGTRVAPLCLAWRRSHEGRALEWFVERLATPQWRAVLLGA
jgi:DNA-binding transcriptional LysR family regulator